MGGWGGGGERNKDRKSMHELCDENNIKNSADAARRHACRGLHAVSLG